MRTREGDAKNPDAAEKQILEDLNLDIENKEKIIGPPYLNYIIKEQYLKMVDDKWLDHLENMEALREAVHLRSYAQKNPLTEYKVEGFQIFEKMIDDIRQEIARRLHLIRIQTAENIETRTAPKQTVQTVQRTASHSSVSAFGGVQQGRQPARMQSETATVIRSQPKVGRNDTCPCGSGKKYKYCHGKT